MPQLLESGLLTKSPLLARDVALYHLVDDITEFLLYFMVVFSPWAFGTTESWSIWTMRGCGYGLGLLLSVKLAIRCTKGYRPARWDAEAEAQARTWAEWEGHPVFKLQTARCSAARSGGLTHFALTRVLAFLTVCILAYCLMAAVNAQAAFNPVSGTFEYFGHVRWLPHSFERYSTWEAFWSYLALAWSFWAIRDWLLGKSKTELRAGSAASAEPGRVSTIPARLRRLLWVLSFSGGWLALEGLVQRLTHSPKLLFLVQPVLHQSAETQFASYAYRANGAQYFNLLWPVCLGFWWMLHRPGRLTGAQKCLPLVCAGLMAICPLLSAARGAALVDLGMLGAAVALLLGSLLLSAHMPRITRRHSVALLVMYFVGVLALGLIFGWHQLRPRMERFRADLNEREQLYEPARRIARDYPVFGTGPGTFERMFQLYRRSPDAYWPAQLHNDWLETRVTFGWLGSALIGVALLVVGLRWFAPGGVHLDPRFVMLLWLSLGGCLLQARWDFPLQVYSILFQFLVWCAVLFTLSR